MSAPNHRRKENTNHDDVYKISIAVTVSEDRYFRFVVLRERDFIGQYEAWQLRRYTNIGMCLSDGSSTITVQVEQYICMIPSAFALFHILAFNIIRAAIPLRRKLKVHLSK